MTDQDWMRRALDIARRRPQAPFAAVIAHDSELVAEGLNHAHDHPIWHGEMDALVHVPATAPWAKLTLYTTAEPCPMCCSAICWSGIGRIVYAISIPTLTELGWHQIDLRAEEVCRRSFHPVTVTGGVLADDCRPLFVRHS